MFVTRASICAGNHAGQTADQSVLLGFLRKRCPDGSRPEAAPQRCPVSGHVITGYDASRHAFKTRTT